MLEIQKVIEKFRNVVIQQARSNLSKQKKNDTKELYNSLKGEIVTEKDFTIVGFSMSKYGKFQDQGVKGVDPSKVSPNAKIKGQQAPNSPFSFKTLPIPYQPLAAWAKRKNLRLRDKKGKFKKGSYQTIGIIIARNIFYRGIKPSLFFTTPFESAYKKYIDTDLIKAFGQDIDIIIDDSLKDIK